MKNRSFKPFSQDKPSTASYNRARGINQMKKLLILSTGGTIDKIYFDAKSEYEVGKPVATTIFNAMNVAFKINQTEVCRKDSLEINSDDRQKLKTIIDQSDAKAILITHGTDTMVDTALSLGDYTDRVIVFTGAMQPAIFKETDAIFNLGTALGALNCAQPGVYIAMNGCIFPAGSVVKNYTTRAFEEN